MDLLQVKRFPPALRKALKAKAALEGSSFRQLIINLLTTAVKGASK